MKTILIVTIILFIFIIIFYSLKTTEGLATPGNLKSPGVKTDNITNSSALDKFANALSTAFSSDKSSENKSPFTPPAWSTQLSAATSNVAVQSIENCNIAVQSAVDPLPIDKQAQTTINDHSNTINSILDEYDAKLKKIETLLVNPESILGLNSDIGIVVNLGIPISSVTYDADSNSIINLSVVKGTYGVKGDQPEPISGIGIIGDVGDSGNDGINPINVPEKNLPYWAK
jgi:hypothetical protein